MDRQAWNERYAGVELLWAAEPNRFLVQELSELAPGLALDLACGEGRNAVWLAARGWTVDAVDFSDVALDKARRLAASRGVSVEWILADLETYRPDEGRYELVIVFYLQLPWDRMRSVLERAAAALAPKGTLLVVGHDRTNLEQGYGGPKSPDVLYTPQQLAAELTELELVEAARRLRPVETAQGVFTAIDCLVRARRSKG